MSKLIMWNLQTLDGYFEGSKAWDLDFHGTVWGPELEQLSIEQLKTAGALVFGRATYQGMADYWTKATGEVAERMNAIPKLVFSHTLTEAPWQNSRLVTGPAEGEMARLKREPGKDLFIFGSADLSATFMQHGLIDEYRICVVPLVRGGGNPLFKRSAVPVPLKLLDAKVLASGGVILRYEAVR